MEASEWSALLNLDAAAKDKGGGGTRNLRGRCQHRENRAPGSRPATLFMLKGLAGGEETKGIVHEKFRRIISVLLLKRDETE